MEQTSVVPAQPPPELPVAQPLAAQPPTAQPLTAQSTRAQPPSGDPRVQTEPGKSSAPAKLAPILCTVGGRRPRTSYHPASPPPRSASQQQHLLQQLELQPQQRLGHDGKALARADDQPVQTHEPIPIVPKHITSALDQVRHAQGAEGTAVAQAVYVYQHRTPRPPAHTHPCVLPSDHILPRSTPHRTRRPGTSGYP